MGVQVMIVSVVWGNHVGRPDTRQGGRTERGCQGTNGAGAPGVSVARAPYGVARAFERRVRVHVTPDPRSADRV